jgi:hypothetical protein
VSSGILIPGPLERASQLRRLIVYLPALAERLGGDTRWLEAELRQLQQRQTVPVDFALIDGGRFAVDGQVLPHCGAGLALAWLALACAQHRIEPPRVEHLGRGARKPGTTVLASLRRVADRVERSSPALASAARALGVERGYLVPKSSTAQVRCTSPVLERLFSAS